MKDWERSEHEAEYYGTRTPGSGSGINKMDIKGEGDFLGIFVENKHTEKNSFSVTADMIKKGIKQANQMGGRPVWRIDLGSHNIQLIIQLEKDFINGRIAET